MWPISKINIYSISELYEGRRLGNTACLAIEAIVDDRVATLEDIQIYVKIQ